MDNAIDEARRAAGMTIKALADLLGAPYRTVQNWCDGSRVPPVWLQRLIIAEIERSRR